jgi:CDP-4-dehydro-6-deoxyglucose reductase, E1
MARTIYMKKDSNPNRVIKRAVKKIFTERQKEYKKNAHKNTITVGWPVYDEKEILRAIDALLDLRLSQGPAVREFEAAFAKYVGTKYAVAVNSGSSANLLALNALIEVGQVARGSEVIIPAATFATVASPIIQLGLIPVYVDVDPVSWNIDPKEAEKAITKKTRVIMPVHSFGNPADMKTIMGIARKHKLIVVEDCCEAHGAAIDKKKVGSFGDMGTLSFFVAHNITTGEGGMIFTNSKKYYDALVSLREFGRLKKYPKKRFGLKDPLMGNYDERYMFTNVGYNVRMTDIAASLGIEQLKKLDLLNAKRIRIVKEYQRHLDQYNKFLELPKVRKGDLHSFYGYPFLVKENSQFSRNKLALFLESRGIETRAFFAGCLPDQPGFKNKPKRVVGKLPESRYVRDKAIFIGCHPALTKIQIMRVKKAFDDFFKRYQK